MEKHNRTAPAATFVWTADRTGSPEGSGFIECAIVAFAGLAVGLLLVANGLFASVEQLLLLQ